jgi:glycosyltransferase involved in cell wall biosynthesis
VTEIKGEKVGAAGAGRSAGRVGFDVGVGADPRGSAPRDSGDPVDVSFVVPCLDEAETLEAVIGAAQACIDENGLDAEIVVADNGSQDGSAELARRAGARVVDVATRGYGSALMGGFEAARGRYLVMGDADLSYDFREAFPLIERLRAGDDLVMGSRIRGHILPGAMPWLHRWIGNPVLSWIGKTLFRSPISDFHCGLRALTRAAYDELGLRTTGMEFASEMVVKATVRGLRISEVPVTLHPDGRSGSPHLRTWRDGWRHLRFMLCLSPRWTLFAPGLALAAVGAIALMALWLSPQQLGSVRFGVHSMLAASLAVLVGYQAMTTALAARLYAVEEEIGPPAEWLDRAVRAFSLERGLLAGVALAGVGLAFIGSVFVTWAGSGFGDLVPEETLRPMILGATFVALGVQTLLMSFLYSMLGIQRRRDR